MRIDRRIQAQFLEDELRAETESYKKKFLTSAISLLKNDEMFVAQYVGFRAGQMVMKFPNTRALPRKGEFLQCMALPPELQNYRNWGDMTYQDLYRKQLCSTEAVCVWHGKADDERFSLVGFSRIDLNFADKIRGVPGLILTFAPQRPPIDYMLNLQSLVENEGGDAVSSVLDVDFENRNWTPLYIRQNNVSNYVYTQLQLTDTMILQGPPGTGKTFVIAELCARLCAEGKSVLVTAMTNRALMELAAKEPLSDMLQKKKIFKTNVTTDELESLDKIQPAKQPVPMPSCLMLSTFYVASGGAVRVNGVQAFDYVIMDEASQALLPMFAAAGKLGAKNLWVGDICQLSPIVALNKDRIRICGYQPIVDGLRTAADVGIAPVYQMTTTYRFGQRAADYTGIFYNKTLKAKDDFAFEAIPMLDNVLSSKGGPTLVMTDMPPGNNVPEFANMLVAYILKCILAANPEKEVAVLSCMKNTVRALQRTINQYVECRDNVLVDTVARVQGLTTDITIFIIPNTSYIHTAEQHLFNVATSRAREHTIIIVDKSIFRFSTIKPLVKDYLSKLVDDQSIYVSEKMLREGASDLKLR